jgi:hypothetical protein
LIRHFFAVGIMQKRKNPFSFFLFVYAPQSAQARWKTWGGLPRNTAKSFPILPPCRRPPGLPRVRTGAILAAEEATTKAISGCLEFVHSGSSVSLFEVLIFAVVRDFSLPKFPLSVAKPQRFRFSSALEENLRQIYRVGGGLPIFAAKVFFNRRLCGFFRRLAG